MGRTNIFRSRPAKKQVKMGWPENEGAAGPFNPFFNFFLNSLFFLIILADQLVLARRPASSHLKTGRGMFLGLYSFGGPARFDTPTIYGGLICMHVACCLLLFDKLTTGRREIHIAGSADPAATPPKFFKILKILIHK